jgi:hypothetical protein
MTYYEAFVTFIGHIVSAAVAIYIYTHVALPIEIDRTRREAYEQCEKERPRHPKPLR